MWRSDRIFPSLRGDCDCGRQAGRLGVVFYEGGSFGDIDICVDVTIPETRDRREARGGLAFWAVKGRGFYVFEVTPDGRAGIGQFQGGMRSSPPGPLKKVEDLKTEAGASNTLRITLKGATATAYINDKPFETFEGQPPRGGGLIGFFGRSEAQVPNVWTFANVKVTK